MSDRHTKALADVPPQRQRQIEKEGWSFDHDDQHSRGEIAAAAGCYALHAHDGLSKARYPQGPAWWPWDAEWWKPTTARQNLVKAAALCLAEIERLDRLEVNHE